MANEMRRARSGLASLLAAIPGLRVHDHPPGSLNELPAAVVMFESRQPSQTMGGAGFSARFEVVLLASSADAQSGLDGFMDPMGGASVEAAVDADPTWGGSVDDARLLSIGNVGRRKLWGGEYIAATFHFEAVKG